MRNYFKKTFVVVVFLVGNEELLMVSTKPRAIGERRLAMSNAVRSSIRRVKTTKIY